MITDTENSKAFSLNLQYLRSQKGWSQEALAEQLSVSRQSVSKWESGSAWPEMSTLLALCNLFETDLDTLLRGSVQKTHLEDAAGYDKLVNWFSVLISSGVALILFGVGLTVLWSGLVGRFSWPESTEALGAAILLLCVLVAVTLFIVSGIRYEQFCKQNPVLEDFYSDEQKEVFRRRFVWLIAGPVAAILGGVVILVALAELSEQMRFEELLVAGFLWIIGAASAVLTYTGLQADKYNLAKYNLHNTPEYKRMDDLTGMVCGGIMLTATAGYIALAQLSGGWGDHWWIFAVGGLLCAISATVIEFNWKRKMRTLGTEEEALE